MQTGERQECDPQETCDGIDTLCPGDGFTADGTAAVSVATYRADTCRLTFGDSGALEISHDEQPERQAS